MWEVAASGTIGTGNAKVPHAINYTLGMLIILTDAAVGQSDGTSVSDDISQAHDTVDRRLTFFDQEFLQILLPARVETAQELLDARGLRVRESLSS